MVNEVSNEDGWASWASLAHLFGLRVAHTERIHARKAGARFRPEPIIGS